MRSIMPPSRGFPSIVSLLLILCFALRPVPAAATEKAAKDFLVSLNREAVAQFRDPNLDDVEKEQRFRDLAERSFDIPRISKFVLGVNWRRVTPEQQKDFITIFKEVNTQRFLPMFSKYSDQTFTVTKVRQDENKSDLFFVYSTITRPEGEPINVEWRVFNRGDQFTILDVVAEGVSMVLTLRKEYGSVINNDGLDGLIAQLRKMIEEGTTESAIPASTQ